MSENISDNGGFLPAGACIGFSGTIATTNVTSLACDAVTSNIIVVTSATAGSVTLQLQPTAPGATGAIIWTCVRAGGNNRHVPSNCRV